MQHTKLKRLVRALKIRHYAAVGVLESLWHLTAREAPEGNIGKLSNEDIAVSMDWDDAPDDLIAGLVTSGWLDVDEKERLVVHDWFEHADDATKLAIKRKLEKVSGNVPQIPTVSDKTLLPLPLPLPEPVKNKQKITAVAVELPGWVDKGVWEGFMEVRRNKRAKPTELALKGILTQLGKFRNKGHDPNAVLETSIRSNWTDVYEPKTGARNGNESKGDAAYDALRRSIQAGRNQNPAGEDGDTAAGEGGGTGVRSLLRGSDAVRDEVRRDGIEPVVIEASR